MSKKSAGGRDRTYFLSVMLHHYDFRHTFVLWSGLSLHPFGRSPLSLYTFLFRGLARDWHFKAFPEFEELSSENFFPVSPDLLPDLSRPLDH